MVAISAVLVVLISASLVWYFYRYDATVLSLSYKANPVMASPLSGADYSWEARAFAVRVFGNSPFNGEGYVHRERITSENKFRNEEFHNLNASLRLRFQVTNAAGNLICNQTVDTKDGCDREVVFEFKPEAAKAGNALQIKVTLNLNVNYNYGGAGGQGMQFTLQKEWTKTIQVQQTEPQTGETF